jgi:RNA polymerase sigma-70 factor (ECF subfamily)
MSEDETFRDLIRRVRAGDAQASAELVRQYEPAIRLAVHVRLTDPDLRRFLDSQDICDSVLGSFFVRAASGQYDLDTPEQLVKLLTKMARNKLVNYARKERAARRDHRRAQQGSAGMEESIDPSPGPYQVAVYQELLQKIRQSLSKEERQLADLRARGHSWKEVAAVVGGEPNTLRMRLARAVTRSARTLGLEE